MGRYGLGFGAQASARPSRGGSPADNAARIAPAAGWTGVAGSGFGGSPPTDPARVTAKPALRLVTPPRQAFTNTQLVGVLGGANDEGTLIDNLGIEKIVVHFEGSTFDIDAPTMRSFADANGQTVSYYGWWIMLEKPSGVTGAADVYFEAVPRDVTMQHRVIGPYTYFPVDQQYDFTLEVAASTPEEEGVTYPTIQGALGYLRSVGAKHPQITVVEAGEYDLEGSNFPYAFDGWCELVATAPITITRPEPDAGESFRPRRGPIRFKGSNITIDFIRASELHTEPGQFPFWCDGVNLTNSDGRESLRFKANRNLLTHLIRDFGWMTECTVTSLWSAGARCELVRGCIFSNTWGDSFTGSRAVIGCSISDHDSAFYRQYVDAFSVSYSGAGQATLEMSGGNGTNGRVLDAKVDGASIATFTVNTGFAAFSADTNYTIQNVVDWLNSLPDWSATLIDNDRIAVALQETGTIGAWGPLAISGVPTAIPTYFDIHADMFQTTGENIVLWGNSGHDLDAQVFFMANFTSSDFLMVNNAFATDPESGLLSQFQQAQSHVVFAHNALPSQLLALRNDAPGASRYDPDQYCLIANNALAGLTWNGGSADADLDSLFNHVNGGSSIPEGAIGTSAGGSALGNFADAAEGDFTPSGALLAFPKPPTVRFDTAGNARRSPVAPVGAVRGPVGSDVIDPLITSADPSGSYVEGDLITGQLTASEPVTWLVNGQDAALLALDPDTGAWSLGPTDFATQSSYAFTFEAIDVAGNGASQPVAIAITQAAGNGPVLSNITDDPNGATGATISLNTDTADGTLHWALVTDGSTPDTAAIKAGTGFAASGTQAVSAIGAQVIAIAGLAAATGYTAHVVHSSAAGSDSAVASGDGFVTLPGGTQTDAIVIFVAGQSNARKASTSSVTPPARYTALSDTHIWAEASGQFAAYVAGSNSDTGGTGTRWGSEAEVAYQLRQAGETRPIYIIKEAEHGNSLAASGSGDWDPNTSGERWDQLVAQTTAARAWFAANTALTNFEEFTLWNQGEADANTLATADAYAANWTAFLTAYRASISTGFFIAERIRPLGYEGATETANTAGFGQGYKVREATIAGILADGNGTVIDTDFDLTNFDEIHPSEPDPWDINSWTTQCGLRCYEALPSVGTYTATHGDITDAVPDAFVLPAVSAEETTTVSSASVNIAGIERQAAVVLPAGVEMQIRNRNGSLHTDWTNTPGFVDKFQSFVVRATAPADGVTDTHAISIGGVPVDWVVTGTVAGSYRADTQAWLDALLAAGGTSLSPAQAGGLDSFLGDLATASILPKIKAHAYALGSEIANTIRVDDPSLIGVQEGPTQLPWATGGYLATSNNQRVNMQADPSALTAANNVSLTCVIEDLGSSTNYIVNSGDGTLGMRFSGSAMRVRVHSTAYNFTGLTLTKTGPYTATSDGATVRLYDPDGLLIASSVTVGTVDPATASDLLIGNSGGTDQSSRLFGLILSDFLTGAANIGDPASGEIATLHSEINALQALF